MMLSIVVLILPSLIRILSSSSSSLLFLFLTIQKIYVNVINNKANNNKIEEKKIRKSKDEMGEKGNKGIFFFSQIVKSS